MLSSFRKDLRLLLFAALLYMLCAKALGQSFNYTLSVDSAGTYTALAAKTAITGTDTVWDFVNEKAIGFSFPFNGQSFDSIYIERNSYIVFDRPRTLALLVYPGFSCKPDSQGNYSPLEFNLEGSAPNRILKLQYTRVGQTEYPAEYLSYQVWLHESGRIDVITGAHTYPIADSTNYSDTLYPCQIGLINPNMNTTTNGLFLKGSPTQPASQPINETYTDISFLRSFPRPGTKYSFIPD